ncbi:MAG: taurine transporter permease [Bacteroidetes bacterium]|nr:taurine transporter permease [Bacteroidota bacterium]
MKTLAREKIKSTLLGCVGIILVLLVWLFAFQHQKAGVYLIPSPISTFQKLGGLFASVVFYQDVAETLLRMLSGFFLATLFGIVLGLLLGNFPTIRKMFNGIIDFLRSIPVTALYPIFILTSGIGSESKIAMIFYASFFIICINTMYGVMHTNPVRRKMAQLYGANWYQVFTQVTFFDSLPYAMVGLRIAISYALIVAILTEFFMGSSFGLGQRITETYNLYQIDAMYAYIIIVGLLGYSLNFIFNKIEKAVVGWKFNAD